MNNSSNFTGRTHRSLHSAYGPYARTLHVDPPKPHWGDRLVLAASVVALVVIIVLAAL